MSGIPKFAILEPVSPSPMLRFGVARIQDKAPHPVDVLHGRNTGDPMLADYNSVLELDERVVPAKGTAESSNACDCWAVEVSGGSPKRISITAETERARLFALYHIAACLEKDLPTVEWAIVRKPLIPRRYAWISAGNCWSDVCRPDWFDRDIEDIPGMGFNGVLLTPTPTHGTSIGRQTLPFTLTEGGVEVDRLKLPAFSGMFDRFKSYGLDISLLHQAFIPPQYAMDDVRAHYNGKRALPGLENEIEKCSRAMASAIFEHLPQVDSLLFHSLECEWMWGSAVSMFPSKDDEASERSLDAYLRGLLQACEEHGKELMFWTHVSGISARQIRLMHQVLERHPSVMVVEDHKWQNNTWPHSPVMGHVAEDIRQSVTSRRWGMSIVSTDGEYYGAGALPTAYPDPNVLAAKTAAERGAGMAFVRFNEQSLTPLRTLEDVNAIHVIATSEQWWEPARSMDELWLEWCERRFGASAAPVVVSALKKSEAIIMKGLSAGRQPLIDHSGLSVGCWRPGADNRAWGLFARPGQLMVEKPWDELVCEEMRPWQVNARGVELEDFLRDSAEAQAAAREALREIESVRGELKPEDFDYLTVCFEDARRMMEAIRRAATGVRASADCLRDASEINRRTLEEACAAMEACADRIEKERGVDFCSTHHFMKAVLDGKEYHGYGVPITLRILAGDYRKCIDARPSVTPSACVVHAKQ